ncbi:pyocin activator PrtN family protein, partial [Pseudomonas aeruginosa]|uniref:pyocin activator PrtN family protein n=1 Tax=Pseudomonas aeruginosa TaxID=287 RepID=UPI0031B72667
MNTLFLLMAQYNGLAIIPLNRVCADYFSHLTVEQFQRKVLAGQIQIPITRIESSQKAARGIHLADLAAYLDKLREVALKDHERLNRARPPDLGD